MKRHCYAPFLAVLFDRTTPVELTTPGGKTVTVIDDAPNVLRVDTPDGFRYFEATADGYAAITDDAKVEGLAADFSDAPVAKRAPKT